MPKEKNGLKIITLKYGVFCIERRTKKKDNIKKSRHLSKFSQQKKTYTKFIDILLFTREIMHSGKELTCHHSVPSKLGEKINFANVEYCKEFEEIKQQSLTELPSTKRKKRKAPTELSSKRHMNFPRKRRLPQKLWIWWVKMTPSNPLETQNKFGTKIQWKFQRTLKQVNVADETHQVLCSLQTSDFIQEVYFTNRKTPFIFKRQTNQIHVWMLNLLWRKHHLYK